MEKTFLDKAYGLEGTKATQNYYDEWATAYEAEVAQNGYVTPKRVAKALAKFARDKATPLLDFGCGTGLSGIALKAAGFETLHGLDLSAEMLSGAREKGIYRTLTQVDPDGPQHPAPESYALITAIGAIGAGAAPAAVFDTIMNGLVRGGLFAFSFNDHTLEDPAYEARIMSWCDCGAAQLKFRENGPHLPGIGMSSTVYVLQKS